MKKIFTIITISSVIFSASMSYSLPAMAVSLEIAEKGVDIISDLSKENTKDDSSPSFSNSSGSSKSAASKNKANTRNQRPVLESIAFKMSPEQMSSDPNDWQTLYGNLSRGFFINIPTSGFHYGYQFIKISDSSVNMGIAPGNHPFTLISAPAAFDTYYQASDPMRAIANGEAPIFYMRSHDDNSLSLLNGLNSQRHWRIGSTWPAGEYRVSGRLMGENGLDSEPIIMSFFISHNDDNGEHNYAPETVNDTYTVESGALLSLDEAEGILSNDIDLDGPNELVALRTSIVDGLEPEDLLHGRFNLRADGSFSYQSVDGFVGTAVFYYRAFDGQDSSRTTIVNINVTAVGSNQAPVAVADAYTVVKNTRFILSPQSILDNDSDPDNGPENMTVKVVTWPFHGEMVMGVNGNFRYDPDGDFLGNDYFTYRAFDGQNTSNLVRVDLNVSNVANQAPVAVADAYTVVKNTRFILSPQSILDNDSDPDNGPSTMTVKVETWPSRGAMIMGVNGNFRYDPNESFLGNDYFTYRAFDGQNTSNLVRVDLAVVNDGSNQAPVAVADTYETVNNSDLNVSAASGVLANDTDSEHQALRAVLNTTVSNGVLTLNSDGSFNYNATDGFVGNDVFTYRAFDGTLYSEIVNVSINVTAPSSGGGGGGGGGGSVRNPRNASIVINNNAVSTNTVSVNLTLSADNMIATYAPLEMRISNYSNFNNAAWRPYATTTSWTLLSGNGNKTVYAQFKNKRGVSSNVSDSIQLIAGQVLGDRDCSGVAGSLFSLLNRKDATVYYISSDCKKHAFPDPKTYYTWYNDFSKVVKVTASELDLYLEGNVISYRPGIKLVTTADTNRVYAVEPDGVLRHITSPAMARALYGDNWQNLVQDVITGYFATTYTKGSSLNDLLPTGTLAKEPDNDTIYYVQNGQKRPFSSLAAFNANYFRMKDVVIKNSLANYGVGSTINRFDASLLPYPLIN